jgi:hypothetical protein
MHIQITNEMGFQQQQQKYTSSYAPLLGNNYSSNNTTAIARQHGTVKNNRRMVNGAFWNVT